MVEQVKPCPFCGQSGPTKIGYWPDLHGLNHYMQCVCGARHGMNMGEEAAIAAWNTRPTEAAAEARGMEKAAKIVIGQKYVTRHVEASFADGDSRPSDHNETCDELADRIRAALNGGQHEQDA